jgi:hypothetical protein
MKLGFVLYPPGDDMFCGELNRPTVRRRDSNGFCAEHIIAKALEVLDHDRSCPHFI